MTPAAGPNGPTPAAPHAGTAAYEELRAWATGRPLPGPRPPGLALLLRFGVPAWLTAAVPWQPPAAQARPLGGGPTIGQAAGPPAAALVDLTFVLATMVAACHPLGRREPEPPEGEP